MSRFVGKRLDVEIYGESHAEEIGVIVKGLKGYPLFEDKISETLARRKANASAVYSTSRVESDLPEYSGVVNGIIEDVFCAKIKNANVKSGDYSSLYGKPRPSHADYAWYLRDGTLDFSGGGRFSGRLTAPFCVVGGECLGILESKGVYIAAYAQRIGKVCGLGYRDKNLDFDEVKRMREGFPSLSNKEEMLEEIKSSAAEGDSVGGKIECVVYGLKGGVGDNLFGGLEGKISALLYSIPAVKGVEFGYGFDLCQMRGGEANDGLRYRNGEVVFEGNRSGGINGGISNGNVLTIGVAVKPTPSISKEQRTVDLINKENAEIRIKGRHDPCILPRALPAVESAVGMALLDELL